MKLLNKHIFDQNGITLLKSGHGYFNRVLILINQAKKTIYLQVYIFDLDETGNEILAALKQAAKRGVKVFILVDGFASSEIKPAVIADLKLAGIKCKLFAPIKSYLNFKVGRRMHQKVFLFDEEVAVIGGINIANKYSGYPNQTPWLDFAVEVSGPICADIKKVCNELFPRNWINKLDNYASIETKPVTNGYYSRLTQNNWGKYHAEISWSYRNAIRQSQKNLTIVASYFLPSNRIRRLLKAARKRKVDITLILVGQSDVPLVKNAMQFLYSWLHQQKITIYEWKPSVLHAKIALADEEWATIGSYNLNALSDFGSIELNVEVQDKNFALLLQQEINQIISDGCQLVEPTQYPATKGIINRFINWVSYGLIRISLKFLFRLMKQPSNFQI